MKALFIGGTGNISTACSKLAIEQGVELYILNRGNREVNIEGAKILKADINKELEVMNALKGHPFDVVANFIAFKPSDVERDYRIFKKITRQYIFISSASVYQKPLLHPVVTESTPLTS